MAKNVHQKSIEYIKDNFNINELSNFYVKDFVNDGRNNDFASIKSNPKAMNFVKHTNKLSEMTVSELLNYKVSDFSFFTGLDDYVNFTRKSFHYFFHMITIMLMLYIILLKTIITTV